MSPGSTSPDDKAPGYFVATFGTRRVLLRHSRTIAETQAMRLIRTASHGRIARPKLDRDFTMRPATQRDLADLDVYDGTELQKQKLVPSRAPKQQAIPGA